MGGFVVGWVDGRERKRERERSAYLMIWFISVVLTAQQSSDKPLKFLQNILLQTHNVGNNLDHEIRKSNYTKAKAIYLFISSFLKLIISSNISNLLTEHALSFKRTIENPTHSCINKGTMGRWHAE